MLAVRCATDSPQLSASKITNWDTRLEVLGYLVDTEALAVTAPPHNRLKLRLLLAEWPPTTRTYASAKQVSQLAGFLMHIFCRLFRVFFHASFVGFGWDAAHGCR